MQPNNQVDAMGLEAIEYMNQAGQFLDKFYLFKGLKYILAFYCVIMAVASILIGYRLVKFKYWQVITKGEETPVSVGKMQQRWNKAYKRLDSDDSNEWKAAILEAATMLNEILAIVGYSGETLGEKINNMGSSQIENLEAVREANNIKNQIVKDSSFAITKEEAEKITKDFGEALQFFEAIQL